MMILKEIVATKDKVLLTVEEASCLFNIGQNKLRTMISLDPEQDYLLRNGRKVMIKRRKFQDYIESVYSI